MGLSMRALLISFFAVCPLATLVGGQDTIPSKTYAVQDFYQGTDFFNSFWFFTGSDPANGNVNYLSENDAVAQKLASVNQNDNTFTMAVDSTSSVPPGGKRNSVRIISYKSYSSGLFILDAVAMPVGCGTWPSFWTTSGNIQWPLAGEIDIVEGVNDQQYNQMTLHSGTPNPCTINVTATQGEFTGHVLHQDCSSSQTSNSGCTVSDIDSRSFGYGFNNARGGVFAFLWDPSFGVAIWHFARADIPQDITNKYPNPANWGKPSGLWSAHSCDIAANFYDQSLIFDIDICGGWASGAYSQSGCSGTCSQMVADASNFADAKWRINYLAVYQ